LLVAGFARRSFSEGGLLVTGFARRSFSEGGLLVAGMRLRAQASQAVASAKAWHRVQGNCQLHAANCQLLAFLP